MADERHGDSNSPAVTGSETQESVLERRGPLGSTSSVLREALVVLFDEDWYRWRYPDVAGAGWDPLNHYLRLGASEGRSPGPLFDADWYAKELRDSGVSGVETDDPLRHYLTAGWERGLDPSPYFDTDWYLETAGALAVNGNPLLHYIEEGWERGLDPSPYFDTDWYLECHPDVGQQGFDPLGHYLRLGSDAGYQPNPYFDPAWYRDVYPDIAAAGVEPLWHYIETGAYEGRDPSPFFNTTWYRSRYPEVADSGLNPLRHFLQFGREQGLATVSRTGPPPEEPTSVDISTLAPGAAEAYVSQVLRTGRPDPREFVPFREYQRQEQAIRVISFYLPQYHPIPENDNWWGKGFTEWTNVSRAVPQFVGHYQPRLPADLGFYDLRVDDVMTSQVELARNYGISAFCFHYYWFGGRRLLERPLETFLQDPTLNLSFCVSWANENWTRRWDGNDQQVLIAQTTDPAVDATFADDMVPLMRDQRYLRIDGMPLLLVYRPALLADAPATASSWRESFRDAGIGEVLLASVQFDIDDPRPIGFDLSVEFPPHKLAKGIPRVEQELDIVNARYRGIVHRYSDVVDAARRVSGSEYPLVRGVMPSWDNTARNPETGTCYLGASPEAYRAWLDDAARFAIRHPVRGESLVFVNAWNEWAESAYLEPDRRFGYGYLDATRAAIDSAASRGPRERARMMLVVHDAANHGAQHTALNLARTLTEAFDVELAIVLMKGGPLAGRFAAYGPVHDLSSIQDIPAQEAIFEDLYRRGTSVAICNTVVTGKLVKRLASIGFRVLSLIHELPGLIGDYGLLEDARTIARHAETVVFPSEFVHRSFEELAGPISARAVIRPQGLYRLPPAKPITDAERRAARMRLGLPERSDVVLTVGYADLRKGIDIFMRVFEAVGRSQEGTVFVWLGCEDPEQIHWYGHEATTLGLSDRLRLLPRVDDVEDYYTAATVLLLPSREDPFPSVVLEALSYSVPVVAFESATGSVDVLDRGAGVTVQYGDTAAMAGATLRLLGDQKEREELGTTGRSIVRQDFRWADYVSDLVGAMGMPTPSVSVVVPNYNYARYLHQRITSIQEQTYPIRELIILDDASTDGSVELIDELAGSLSIPIVKVDVNPVNEGNVFRQWARGVEMATCDLVWIAEADDFAEPEFLARLVPWFQDGEVTLAYAQSRQVGPQGEVLANDYLDYVRDIDSRKWLMSWRAPGRDEIERSLSVKNTIPNVSAVVFRRGRLAAALAHDMAWITSYRTAGDWAAYVSVLLQGGDIAFEAKPLNNHRRHGGGVAMSSFGSAIVAEIERMQAEIRERVTVDDCMKERARAYLDLLTAQFADSADERAK